MYVTLGREGESVLTIGTNPIYESDRKRHQYISEKLVISHNITLFHRIVDVLS